MKQIVKIVWGLLFLHASVAYATEEDVPAQGERMIQEAAQDLSRRYKEGQWAYDSAVDLRRCIDERIISHKISERYNAQRCFVEWRTIQLGILQEEDRMEYPKKKTYFSRKPFSPDPLTSLEDIFLFDTKSERVWSTVNAPRKIMDLFLHKDGAVSADIETSTHKRSIAPHTGSKRVAPPDASDLVEKAADDIIKNIHTYVTPLEEREKKCDYDEEFPDFYNNKERKYSLRIREFWMNLSDCITEDKKDQEHNKKDICFVEMSTLRRFVPDSYDWEILDNIDYSKTHYSTIIPELMMRSELEFYEIEHFYVNLSENEEEWVETSGADEVWKRVQEKFRWH